ncbi:hypothetical protein LXA43DRAFT_977006 [Ganoderma leucocontextum]|nr:hypothetical protein LXA43DRAFT_977006 [Ganoderma leucocontextum]
MAPTFSVRLSQNDFQREYIIVQDEYLHRLLMQESPPPEPVGSCGHPALWRCLSCHARPTFSWLRQVGVQVHCGHSGSPCPTISTYQGAPDHAPELSSHAPLPSLDPSQEPPTPISLPRAHAPDRDDLEGDEEQPYLIEEPESDLEDEDGDFYYGSNVDAFLPTVADLPWIGEGPRRPAASDPTLARHPAAYGNDRMVVVVDLEGVHELPFTFCACPNAARDDIQLIDLGYYPASVQQPKTVFTTRLLDDFLLSNKECKTSARNYYNKLRRTTNPAFPHMVPDRYKELLRVSRQWRNIHMRRNAGFGHRADAVGPGDLAVRCPACPQPDVNLPEGWRDDKKQWKYTRSVVLDGNFSAQHRKMRNPADDVPLADGHAFMVTDAPYKEHLKTAAEFREKTTCHDHRAVLMATMDRGNLEATGIGAAACSRHGFFAPHACVDFQQGERQRNMDYILHWIFAYMHGLTCILILYDIMCQYFVHLCARFKKSPHLAMPEGLTILRGIGQFHVHGHIAKCFPRFSLNFIYGAGVQDGEIIETLWNKTNAVADSTRGMSAAHRREVIDDHMNDSNWMKLTRISTSVAQLACKESGPASAALEELTAGSDPLKCAEWKCDADAADTARDADPSTMDIYDVSAMPMPTRKEVQIMLSQQELSEGGDAEQLGAADWIATGLRLEETNSQAGCGIHGSPPEGDVWDGDTALPEQASAGDGDGEPDLPADRPEAHPIGLPSTFGVEFLAQTDMLDLAKKERQLREGQLNDSLQGIRTGIGYKSLLYRAKLRSFDDVHVADEGVHRHVRVYQQARRAMEQLFDADDVCETNTPLGSGM